MFKSNGFFKTIHVAYFFSSGPWLFFPFWNFSDSFLPLLPLSRGIRYSISKSLKCPPGKRWRGVGGERRRGAGALFLFLALRFIIIFLFLLPMDEILNFQSRPSRKGGDFSVLDGPTISPLLRKSLLPVFMPAKNSTAEIQSPTWILSCVMLHKTCITN